MTDWAQKLKVAYGRRRYLQGVVKGRAMRLHIGTIEERMERAADDMDLERNGQAMSMAQYLTYLKKHDPTVKKRKRDDGPL